MLNVHGSSAPTKVPGAMLNLLRKFLKPTLREQLEAGLREALRRYADRRTAPDLRVYVSTDLLPGGLEPGLWARDEAAHLRAFASQWAQDNNIARAGMRLELVLLDTKREFAFVKPLGLEGNAEAGAPLVAARPAAPPGRAAAAGGGGGGGGAGGAVFEVVTAPGLQEPFRVVGEVVVGRKAEDGVRGMGDRYMSSRHARFSARGGRVTVTDLDSKNRTFVNDEPLPPHEERALRAGDAVRMGTTTLRLSRTEG